MIRWVGGAQGGQWFCGDTLLAQLSWTPPVRHPYVHPLFTLRGQGPLTNFAPFDHPWHHGLWWSWKTINGVNYWEDTGREGFGACRVTRQINGAAGPALDLDFYPLGNEAGTALPPVMKERRSITAGLVPGWAEAWMLVWRAQFEALEECVLAATPRQDFAWGGYAGLNFRPARSMGLGEELANSRGSTATPCHGERALWAVYSGPVDGNVTQAHADVPHAGVALVWGASEGVPYYCCSTGPHNRAFGFLAAAPLWDGALVLQGGQCWNYTAAAVMFTGPVNTVALDALSAELPAQHSPSQ